MEQPFDAWWKILIWIIFIPIMITVIIFYLRVFWFAFTYPFICIYRFIKNMFVS